MLGLAIAGFVLLAAVLLFIFLPSSGPDFQSVTSRRLLSSQGQERDPSFSPDGRYIAFSWKKEKSDNYDIYVRPVAGGDLIQITEHPGNDCQPTWSPDGQEIAFIRDTEQEKGIYVKPALGGDERKLHNLRNFMDFGWVRATLDWSPDGRYLAFSDADSWFGAYTLCLLDVNTREVTTVTAPPKEILGDWVSAFSPDSKTLAFVRAYNWGITDVFTIPVSGGKPQRLTHDNARAWGVGWSPDSRKIIFSSRGNLWSISASGGKPELLPVLSDAQLTASRSGHRLGFVEIVSHSDIWRVSNTGNQPASTEPFITTTADDNFGRISPDGLHFTYASSRSGGWGVWMCDANAENHVRLAPNGSSPRWSPDGQYVAFDWLNESVYQDIFIVNIEERVPRPFTDGDYNEQLPSWSHDGEWIYYGSNSDGMYNVWKKRIADGHTEQVTFHGGNYPIESWNGQWLYYSIDDTSGIWRKPVAGGEEHRFLGIEVVPASWAISDVGIFYFLDEGTDKSIQFFDFETEQTTKITVIDAEELWQLDASRDGRMLYFSAIEQRISNIVVVENFQW